jgi:hypothetical protein
MAFGGVWFYGGEEICFTRQAAAMRGGQKGAKTYAAANYW